MLMKSNTKKIFGHKLVLEQAGQIIEIGNDAMIVSAGGVLPTPMLKVIGIEIETKYGTT